jgi:hypothetical protein
VPAHWFRAPTARLRRSLGSAGPPWLH